MSRIGRMVSPAAICLAVAAILCSLTLYAVKTTARRTSDPSAHDLPPAAKLDPLLRILVSLGQSDSPDASRLAQPHLLSLSSPGDRVQRPPMDISRRWLVCHVGLAAQGMALPLPGVRPGAASGDVQLVAIKPEMLEELASTPGVTSIELAVPMELKNDASTVETGARAARGEYAATGAGVLVGFIGSGVDVTHPDLLDGDGGSRVLYLLDLSHPGDVNGDGLLDGPDFFGGTLYEKAQIDSAIAGLRSITGSDARGHETHVIGVAAGNGGGTGNGFPAGTFAGVAPEAALVVVKSSLADLGFVGPGEASAGLAFVDSIAAHLGLPFVVNMSFGTHLSAHDGTSLEERFIDNTIGHGVPGKAVVVSAGNEGANDGAGPFLHCSEALEVGGKASCRVLVADYSPSPGEMNDGMILDVWYQGADAMTITVLSPDGETLTARGGESRTRIGSDGSIYIENALFADPRNLDNECFIQIYDGHGTAPAAGAWTIEVTADRVTGDGRFDVWLAFSSGLGGTLGFTADSPVTNERLVATPGNSFDAITVGSYVNKESWLDVDNNLVFFGSLGRPPAGAIEPGSSPGPTRDGRLKPELTAPGRAVASTLSRDAYPGANDISIFDGCGPNAPRCLVAGDGRHALARGTSFAAPHVAGAIALLLELRPDLDAEELRNTLAFAARPQAQTGGPWGYGKLDVLAAARSASASGLLDFFTAVAGDHGVLVSWRGAQGQALEGFVLYRAETVQGPYEIIYTSAGIEGSFLDTTVEIGAALFYRLGVLLPGGAEVATAPISPQWPSGGPLLRLLPPSPNPSRKTTTLRFSSTVAGTALVRAFDAAGRLIGERAVQVKEAGALVECAWRWDEADRGPVPSGVYYLTVEIGGAGAAVKAVVLP